MSWVPSRVGRVTRSTAARAGAASAASRINVSQSVFVGMVQAPRFSPQFYLAAGAAVSQLDGRRPRTVPAPGDCAAATPLKWDIAMLALPYAEWGICGPGVPHFARAPSGVPRHDQADCFPGVGLRKILIPPRIVLPSNNASCGRAGLVALAARLSSVFIGIHSRKISRSLPTEATR